LFGQGNPLSMDGSTLCYCKRLSWGHYMTGLTPSQGLKLSADVPI
jgi:hypothetical protein